MGNYREGPEDQAERLGQVVRSEWVRWAAEQPDVASHPRWILGWEEIEERDREVDRRIGLRVARDTVLRLASSSPEYDASYAYDADSPAMPCLACRSPRSEGHADGCPVAAAEIACAGYAAAAAAMREAKGALLMFRAEHDHGPEDERSSCPQCVRLDAALARLDGVSP